MNRKLLFCIITILLQSHNMSAVAQYVTHDFSVGGFYFNFIKEYPDECSLAPETTLWLDGNYWKTFSDYSGDIVIPSSVTYNGKIYKVTRIADETFSDNDNIRSVVIPASVKEIGQIPFCWCDNLEKVVIQNPECKFTFNAFFRCPKLKTFILGDKEIQYKYQEDWY